MVANIPWYLNVIETNCNPHKPSFPSGLDCWPNPVLTPSPWPRPTTTTVRWVTACQGASEPRQPRRLCSASSAGLSLQLPRQPRRSLLCLSKYCIFKCKYAAWKLICLFMEICVTELCLCATLRKRDKWESLLSVFFLRAVAVHRLFCAPLSSFKCTTNSIFSRYTPVKVKYHRMV